MSRYIRRLWSFALRYPRAKVTLTPGFVPSPDGWSPVEPRGFWVTKHDQIEMAPA